MKSNSYYIPKCILLGSKPSSSTPVSKQNDEDTEDDLAQVLRQSQRDYEKAESLRKQEEEDFQRAINESMKSITSQDESFSLQLSQDDTPPVVSNRGEPSTSTPTPQSSGLVSRILKNVVARISLLVIKF